MPEAETYPAGLVKIICFSDFGSFGHVGAFLALEN
jgi:hypothetical protein